MDRQSDRLDSMNQLSTLLSRSMWSNILFRWLVALVVGFIVFVYLSFRSLTDSSASAVRTVDPAFKEPMYQQSLQTYGTEFGRRMAEWSQTNGGKLPVVGEDAFLLMNAFFERRPPEGWQMIDQARNRSWQVRYDPSDLRTFVITNKEQRFNKLDMFSDPPHQFGYFLRGGKRVEIYYASNAVLREP